MDKLRKQMKLTIYRYYCHEYRQHAVCSVLFHKLAGKNGSEWLRKSVSDKQDGQIDDQVKSLQIECNYSYVKCFPRHLERSSALKSKLDHRKSVENNIGARLLRKSSYIIDLDHDYIIIPIFWFFWEWPDQKFSSTQLKNRIPPIAWSQRIIDITTIVPYQIR